MARDEPGPAERDEEPGDRTLRVLVQRNQASTIVVPDDPPDPGHARWFSPQARRRETAGNAVTYFGTGPEAYGDMASTIRKANGAGDLIAFLGWDLDLSLPLDAGDPKSTMRDLLGAASARGVPIRVMLSAFFKDPKTGKPFKGADNGPTVKEINGLATGGAIEDDRNLDLQISRLLSLLGHLAVVVGLPRIFVGSHHQKLLVVSTAGSLAAFIGGRDVTTFNLNAHDVHGRYEGPAAGELARVFVERWNDHPQVKAGTGNLKPLAAPAPKAPAAPAIRAVQVGATYPNGDKHAGIGLKTVPGLLGASQAPAGYGFASPGDTSIRAMLRHAIAEAKRFIYVEDQFLVDPDVRDRLKAKLQGNPDFFVVMVTNGADKGQGNQMDERREIFIRPLQRIDPKRALAFTSKTYVHSKLWIFDDQYVINGSANCNRRGFTHDSEVVAGVTDPNPVQSEFGARLYLAHALRMKRWATHLGLPAEAFARPSTLYWDPLPGSATVAPWVHKASTLPPTDPWGLLLAGYESFLSRQAEPIKKAFLNSDLMWDLIIDPDGT